LIDRNRRLAIEARRAVSRALGVSLPCPDDMIGSLAAIPIADGDPPPSASPLYMDPLQDRLLQQYRIEVPIIPWPGAPKRLVRLSAQIYNCPQDYVRLGDALRSLLTDGREDTQR